MTPTRQQTIRLFAAARDRVGSATVDIPIQPAATVADLRRALVDAYPELRSFGNSLLVAIDEVYASDSIEVPAQAEVACFPPVSGG